MYRYRCKSWRTWMSHSLNSCAGPRPLHHPPAPASLPPPLSSALPTHSITTLWAVFRIRTVFVLYGSRSSKNWIRIRIFRIHSFFYLVLRGVYILKFTSSRLKTKGSRGKKMKMYCKNSYLCYLCTGASSLAYSK